MLLVRYSAWNGPGAAPGQRLGGGTWLRPAAPHARPRRPQLEDRHVGLDHVAALDRAAPACRAHAAVGLGRLGEDVRTRRCRLDPDAAHRWDDRIGPRTCRRRSATGVSCWMNRTGSAFRGPRRARSSSAAPVRTACDARLPPGSLDVHAARSHRGHVRRQVVALHGDVAEAAAAGQELQPGRALGGRPASPRPRRCRARSAAPGSRPGGRRSRCAVPAARVRRRPDRCAKPTSRVGVHAAARRSGTQIMAWSMRVSTLAPPERCILHPAGHSLA